MPLCRHFSDGESGFVATPEEYTSHWAIFLRMAVPNSTWFAVLELLLGDFFALAHSPKPLDLIETPQFHE